jgi:branched-chain amino acid transport system ATP-binding protein
MTILPGTRSLLSAVSLDAFYGDFQALFGIDFEIGRGEVVAVIGANGAGKSTLLKSFAGLVRNRPDCVRWDGRGIGDQTAARLVRLGLALVPEGRQLFPSLSVEENLLVGAYRGKRRSPWNLASVYEMFPVLRQRRGSGVAQLSGGQQQMVAIGRALMSNPSLLLCDEISLGLAPTVIEDIYRMLPRIREAGTAVVIVEQDVVRALRSADRFYCIQKGRVTLTGRPAEVDREMIRAAYFGMSPA